MLDAFASASWYVDHLLPVWDALPEEARGTFHVSKAAGGARGTTVRRPDPGDRPILVASYGDLRAAQMWGRSWVALGQHGAGQSYGGDHPAYPGGRDQGRATLFLVPNEHAAARTRRAYPRARVETVGCPKLDTLPRKARSGDPVVAFSFHWSGPSIAPEMRSAWDHYRAALPTVAARRQVIGHAHPRSAAALRPWYRRCGIEVVAGFADVLLRADVYVCDNSSSLFEFAATGRPVVVLNTPDYRRSVEHGLRFWSASGIGINVERPADLPEAIDQALDDQPALAAAREAALDIVYQPRSGGSALAAAALVDWAAAFRPQAIARRTRTQIQSFRSVRAERHVA